MPSRIAITNDNLVLSKTAGKGIQVDNNIPTYPWEDLEGEITVRTTGATAPTIGAFRGGLYQTYSYIVGNQGSIEFHMPHDYLPGSDLFLHLHWGHNGTAISGNFNITYGLTYAKGHNQGAFPAEISPTVSYNTVNIATTPQYQHRIDEIQISASSPTATQFNSNIFEPDGLLLCGFNVTSIPTITGGAINAPYIFRLDLHYQSTGVGTKQKAPNFYV